MRKSIRLVVAISAALFAASAFAAPKDSVTIGMILEPPGLDPTTGAAAAIGFPLGVASARRAGLQGPVFAVLNILQTIPSIALFGLLIVPLSALVAEVPRLAAFGVGGIGVAPAIIALVLYALLPVVRSTSVGLAGVDSAAIEAGRGMGMSPGQIFREIELPLALPVLLAGLRIVTVQAIGLAVVAALIGAGGLGTFVFEGLGQYAVDLVLLGALPAIFLALVLRTMDAFRVFDIVFATTNGGPADATNVLMIYAVKQGLEFFNIGFAAAIANVMIICIAIFSFVFIALIRRADKRANEL